MGPISSFAVPRVAEVLRCPRKIRTVGPRHAFLHWCEQPKLSTKHRQRHDPHSVQTGRIETSKRSFRSAAVRLSPCFRGPATEPVVQETRRSPCMSSLAVGIYGSHRYPWNGDLFECDS